MNEETTTKHLKYSLLTFFFLFLFIVNYFKVCMRDEFLFRKYFCHFLLAQWKIFELFFYMKADKVVDIFKTSLYVQMLANIFLTLIAIFIMIWWEKLLLSEIQEFSFVYKLVILLLLISQTLILSDFYPFLRLNKNKASIFSCRWLSWYYLQLFQ